MSMLIYSQLARATKNRILQWNLDAEKYSRCGKIRYTRDLSLFFLALYNQLIISLGKLIVLQGNCFTTIGTMVRCIEPCWGVARNNTGNRDRLP